MTHTVPVRFFTDRRWAPCDVLVQIMDEPLLERVKSVVAANGGATEPVSALRDPNDYALVNWEDIETEEDGTMHYTWLSAEQYAQLSRGEEVTVQLDPYDAAMIYGYDAADTLLKNSA